MAKKVTVPKTYQPPGGRAKEHLRYISEAEERLIERATDGKSNMTEHGVPSLYMEGSDSGNLKDSKPSDTKTSSYNGSAGRDGGMRDSVGANAPSGNQGTQNNGNASAGRYGGPAGPGGSKADIAARNAADVAKQAAAARASAKISTPFASGSPNNNPVNINPFDNLRNAVTQKQAVRAIMGEKPPSGPMGGVPPGQKVTDVFGRPVAQDPSVAGRLAALNAPPAAPPVKDMSRLPGYMSPTSNPGEALQNGLVQQQAAIRALNAARANPNYTNLDGTPPNPNSPANMTPAQQAARLAAITRGPGSVAGVMPDASPLAQGRTLETLAGAMTEGGRPMTKEDLGKLARTVAGESANQPPMGQTAVANTMLNRMALAEKNPEKYGYMGGLDVDSLMKMYDATGMAKRTGGIPNSAFKNAVPGTDTLGGGIASLAGAVAPNSQFNTEAPANIREATSFYNPKVSNPKWGGPQFSALGDHVFGLPDELAGRGATVAAARAMPSAPPVQTASVAPAMAPPPNMQQAQPIPSPMAPQAPAAPGMLSGLLSGLPGVDDIKKAVSEGYETYTDANKKINDYGGGAVVQAMGRLAQMFSGDGGAGEFGPGGQERGSDENKKQKTKRDDDGTLLYKDPVTGEWSETKPGKKSKSATASVSQTSFLRKPLPARVPPVMTNPAAPVWSRAWNA